MDISESQRRASTLLGRTSARRRRADAGGTRLSPLVIEGLRSQLLGMERPSMTAVSRAIADLCVWHGQRPPARASLYNVLPRIEGHTYEVATLPAAVRHALYNLDPRGPIRGSQLAFYCFNYGSLPAASFAAALPWLDLYQASCLRGWRPRSRGLLNAVMTVRGIR
jgi:hypothetical protein